MKKGGNILLGVILIIIGCILALNIFGITNIELFFDGWWTFFIIIPCVIGLFNEHEKTGNIIGICIGVFLLLCCQDVLDFDLMWKLLFPVVIIIVGLKLIFGGMFDKRRTEAMNKVNRDKMKTEAAVFSSANLNYDNEIFHGAEINAVFGGAKCDLRGAVIQEDVVIQASAIFGGIDIYVPENVNVKVTSNSLFGGVSNKHMNIRTEGTVTIYINATCMFGGVDIK
ncbi:hypothetical protein BHF70_02260 [Anaerostipes sp. 494a]|uniref:LiaF transmembrane domain-containing protein n=1 Tax=Anaerostipes sp. 494a TaxID=1261636 RepID=UPI000953499A|nr:LiaF domain-containing protein [Anaerostipes sp. 494a]OLR58546.1 hypothetical protein BHF70_02260 [Anaerostipes sp. 494a]